MNTKALPASLTSYDLLKGLALALMIVDHVGAYFMPDEMWLRAIGRLSAPIWLFLVGYARSRDLSPSLWVGTVLIVLCNLAIGEPVLPLCILATILVCRMLVDPLMARAGANPSSMYAASFVMAVLALPTMAFMDYGLAAMLFALVGYVVRRQEDLAFRQSDVLSFTVFAAGLYAIIQIIVFPEFTLVQKIVAGAGMVLTGVALTRFRSAMYGVTARLGGAVTACIRICGRRTLEIYVIHLILFKFLAALWSVDTDWFSFHILLD